MPAHGPTERVTLGSITYSVTTYTDDPPGTTSA
jgi:hypothetical protein